MSGGGRGPREPRKWVIPGVVAAAAVLGIVSVPVLLSLSGSQSATVQVAAASQRPSASASGTAAVVVSQAPVAASSAPTRAPRASLALATPVPPNKVHVPSVQPSRPSSSSSASASATGQPSQGGGERSGALEPMSGPAGRTVTLSGHCVPGTDTKYSAGSPSATRHPVTADGSFTVREQVATDAAQARTGAQVPLQIQCLDAAGNVTFEQAFTYQVTIVIGLPDQLSGDAGQLNAPQSASAGGTVTVSGGGFMPGSPVVIGVHNVDTGKNEAPRQVQSEDGSVSATVSVPGPASLQIVAAGVDPGGTYRVLVASLTTN